MAFVAALAGIDFWRYSLGFVFGEHRRNRELVTGWLPGMFQPQRLDLTRRLRKDPDVGRL